MKFFDKFKKKTKDILTKFSRTIVVNTSTGTAHWPDRNYENFARETYMKNVISYRCIFYISKISPDGGDNKGVPKELYVLRPDKIQIKTDDKTGLLKQYIYDEKIPFDIDTIT